MSNYRISVEEGATLVEKVVLGRRWYFRQIKSLLHVFLLSLNFALGTMQDFKCGGEVVF